MGEVCDGVSVPIWGLFNLTNAEAEARAERLEAMSFRPHLGII